MKTIISTIWTANFAYAVGLITTDGNLSKDGRHIDFTSKDLDQIEHFTKILNLTNKITTKTNGHSEKKYYHVQFGNVKFYKFLLDIGLTPHKSKTISQLVIADKYFADFLRGCIDGDGNISIVKHPESKHPQLRLRLSSGSLLFLNWVKGRINNYWNIPRGFITKGPRNVYILTYCKVDSIKLLEFMYYDEVEYFLHRKYAVATQFLPK